ncbi:leucine-rich repeat-containing protein 4C [Pimephales promelas]|nr:leucine-rich repeat-containing protein 4C [Pimephales promelas]
MPGTFGPMAILELWLYDNMITHLEENVFSNLTEIRLLVLSRNRIQHISSGAFNGLMELEEISLHTNRLIGIEAGIFKGLPKNVGELKEYDIMVNHSLHTFPTQPFTSAPASDPTTVSEEIEDTSGGNSMGQGLSKDKIIIIVAIVCTAVMVSLIACVLWRRNKRGSQDLNHQRKTNSVI